MATRSIETLVDELKQEEQRVKQEIAELRGRIREKEQELARVRSGLSGLQGKKRTKKEKKSGGQAQAPDVATVREVASQILHEEYPMTEARLEARVRERLEGARKPTARLRNQLEEALKDARFEMGLSGWKLAAHTLRPVSHEEMTTA